MWVNLFHASTIAQNANAPARRLANDRAATFHQHRCSSFFISFLFFFFLLLLLFLSLLRLPRIFLRTDLTITLQQ